MKKYFYTNGKEQFGPYTIEELTDKELTLDTLIWYDGLTEWTNIGNVVEIRDFLKKNPPPIPINPPPITIIEDENVEVYSNNRKYFYIITIVVLISIAIIYFYNKKTVENEVPLSEDENIEIQTNVDENIPVENIKTLSNSEAIIIARNKFKRYSSKIEDSNGAIIAFSKEFIGDINSDGLEDVIVFFALSPAGGGNANVGRGLSIYLNYGNDMKAVAGFEPDYPFHMVAIKNNRVHIIEEQFTESDTTQFSSNENHRYFIWNGSNLQETR